MKVNLLDCTLRDGGYYNNWNFNDKLIEDYINSMHKAKVNAIEFGFRKSKKINKDKGSNFYCDEDFINKFNFPKDIILALMIDAKDFLKSKIKKDIEKNIDEIFLNKSNSRVDMVRIATNINEIKYILPILKNLKTKKYKIALNLMQISEIKEINLTSLIKYICKNYYHYVDILYLADSLGCISNLQFDTIIKIVKKNWKKNLGIHTHDNMRRALSNVEVGLENKANWIDSTIKGMGRGAGNAETEFVLANFTSSKQNNLIPLLNLADNEFDLLKKKYKWGTNFFYYLAAYYKIHPTFIQTILEKENKSDKILKIIRNLTSVDSRKYDYEILNNARKFYKNFKSYNSKFYPDKIINGKNVLLIGPQKLSNNKILYIEKLIKKNNLYVIALNTNHQIKNKFIDVYAISHPIRILTNFREGLDKKNKIIAPTSSINMKQINNFYKKNIYDYGLKISKKNNEINIHRNYCELPNPLVIGYAISIAISGNSKKIIFAGFQGYLENEQKKAEVQELLDLFKTNFTQIDLLSITSTKYNLRKFKF